VLKSYTELSISNETKFDIEGTMLLLLNMIQTETVELRLVNYVDGDKRYILQPSGLKVGDKVQAAEAGLDI
jgi:large subunit ribosomal protein L2